MARRSPEEPRNQSPRQEPLPEPEPIGRGGPKPKDENDQIEKDIGTLEKIKKLIDAWFPDPMSELILRHCRRVAFGPKLKEGERVIIETPGSSRMKISDNGKEYLVTAEVEIDIDGTAAGSIFGKGRQTVSGPGQVFVHLKKGEVVPEPPSNHDIFISELRKIRMYEK